MQGFHAQWVQYMQVTCETMHTVCPNKLPPLHITMHIILSVWRFWLLCWIKPMNTLMKTFSIQWWLMHEYNWPFAFRVAIRNSNFRSCPLFESFITAWQFVSSTGGFKIKTSSFELFSVVCLSSTNWFMFGTRKHQLKIKLGWNFYFECPV